MTTTEKNASQPEPASDTMTKPAILYIGGSRKVLRYLAASFSLSPEHRNSFYPATNYLISGGRPEVIFCDVHLTGGSGIEMHRFVREHPELDQTVFILVADEFSEEDFKIALETRIDDYFVLPLPDPENLRSRVRFLQDYRVRMPQPDFTEETLLFYRIPVEKRILDVMFASLALVMLSPLLLMVMAAIRLESKGKVWYTSRRIGQRPFDFYKFRSMRTGADTELGKLASESNKYSTVPVRDAIDYDSPCKLCSSAHESGNCSNLLYKGSHQICEPWYHYQKAQIARSKAAFIKIKDDPRITRVGKVIRDLSIDELPQLINVIKGDMSLVGNRPLPVYEAEKLTNDRTARRFISPAGLTGLWQVELRGKAGRMSEAERIRLDNKYATMFIRKKYSIWYDVKLLIRTIPAIFQKETV
jgi:lipopolysaccharide/colanic/teichoic acid biosynthesis glycosyltransferase